MFVLDGLGEFDDAFAELAQFNDNSETVVAPSIKHFTWTKTLIIYEWDPITPVFAFRRLFTPILRLPSLPRLSEIRLKKTSGPELLHMLELLKSTECLENVTSRLPVLEVQRPYWLTPKDFLWMIQTTKAFSNLRMLIPTCRPLPTFRRALAPQSNSTLFILQPPETLRILRTLIWCSYFGPHEFMRFLNSPLSRNLKLIELPHISRSAMTEWKVEMETVLQVGSHLGKDTIIPTEIYPEPEFRQPGAIIARIVRYSRSVCIPAVDKAIQKPRGELNVVLEQISLY
ncbi:uncharacterized protein EI90DRAFT_3120503 [Cantharellus anzutake]|uniref:uncharacterized protein n=1 Tax=Cantharellus anzutake TaxID=1750568 RepID=UPI0019085ADC|nr:uncharacterized protein EI90DRAFT_3120503 [Cantharellus anzutake]KAF8335407.1 hypothetical protein EI90DRAFT_3120503 [Cantharellus anzutake]